MQHHESELCETPARRAVRDFFSSSNIQNHFGDPAAVLLCRLRPCRVAAFTSWSKTCRDGRSARRRWSPRAGSLSVHCDVELRVELVLRLTEKDQLIEPFEQQILGRLRRPARPTRSPRPEHLPDWRRSRRTVPGPRSEIVRQVRREDPEAEVGGMLKRFGSAHGCYHLQETARARAAPTSSV